MLESNIEFNNDMNEIKSYLFNTKIVRNHEFIDDIESYDFFKYNGKTNVSVTTFENRKDKYHFYKLSRRLAQKEDMINFIVANGDVLTDIRYGDFMDFHAHHDATATMAVRSYDWRHPFGVVQTEGINITGFEEKPLGREPGTGVTKSAGA